MQKRPKARAAGLNMRSFLFLLLSNLALICDVVTRHKTLFLPRPPPGMMFQVLPPKTKGDRGFRAPVIIKCGRNMEGEEKWRPDVNLPNNNIDDAFTDRGL